jgi:hypothetical protein
MKNFFNGLRSFVTLRWLFSGSTAAPSNVVHFPAQTMPSAQPASTDELIAETMQEAAALTDVHQTPMDKLLLAMWSLFAYLAPIVMAVAAGIWIGDGYTGPHTSAGEAFGIHTISLIGELALALGAVVVAESVKRLTNDRQVFKVLAVSVIVFLLSAAGSATAQWFLILTNATASGYDPTQRGFYVMLGFRVLMPVITDVFSLLYLSIYGRHSLKHKLAQLDERGEAFEKLHERKLRMQEKEEKARQEREDAEEARAARRRREEVLTRIEEIYSEAALAQIERAIAPPRVVDADDESRRQRKAY